MFGQVLEAGVKLESRCGTEQQMAVDPIEVVEAVDVIRVEADRKRKGFRRVSRVVVGELMQFGRLRIVVVAKHFGQPNRRRHGPTDRHGLSHQPEQPVVAPVHLAVDAVLGGVVAGSGGPGQSNAGRRRGGAGRRPVLHVVANRLQSSLLGMKGCRCSKQQARGHPNANRAEPPSKLAGNRCHRSTPRPLRTLNRIPDEGRILADPDRWGKINRTTEWGEKVLILVPVQTSP